MADPESPKPSSSHSRTAVAASVIAIALVALTVIVALNWGEIQLRYHQHRFRQGTPEQQVVALDWMCRNRLNEGMAKHQVEHVLGEPLERRFIWGDMGARKGHSVFGFGPPRSTSMVTLEFLDGKLKSWKTEKWPP